MHAFFVPVSWLDLCLVGRTAGYSNAGPIRSTGKSAHGLLALPAVERYGFLWVHPQLDGVFDPDQLLGGLATELDEWGFGELVNGGESIYDMALNWKLANDTFGETYHFKRLHKDSLANVFNGDVQTYDQFGRKPPYGFRL